MPLSAPRTQGTDSPVLRPGKGAPACPPGCLFSSSSGQAQATGRAGGRAGGLPPRGACIFTGPELLCSFEKVPLVSHSGKPGFKGGNGTSFICSMQLVQTLKSVIFRKQMMQVVAEVSVLGGRRRLPLNA